ncbi:MAG: hypothetical protein ACRDHJ_10685, partial [Actinomycetota bacterium]
LHREQGRLAELEQDRRRALDEYPGYRCFRVMLMLSLSELGEVDDARRMFERFAESGFDLPKDNEWLANLTLLAEVAEALDDRERAPVLYELLAPYAGLVALIASEVSLGPVFRPLGILATLMGEHEAAARHFQAGVAMCERMEARPWLARTQYHYARMLAGRGGDGDRERAAELLADALSTCRRLGMVALAGRISAALEGPQAPGPIVPAASPMPTGALPEADQREPAGAAIFRREGEYFSIAYDGDSFRLKDSKGLRYLAHLLANPGREVHALDVVVHGEGGPERPRPGPAPEPDVVAADGSAEEVIDGRAREEYRRRLRELQEDIDQAEGFGDAERAARAREEMEFLAGELARATGLGGRPRKVASAAERARVNVTKAIRVARDRIREHSPALDRHLQATLHTGTFCSYTPDPRASASWDV